MMYLSSFNEGYALLIAHNNDGTAVGLVKISENIDVYKDRKIIRVFIDDKLLDFEDTDPIIENSRTLVPMRAIFEALGAGIGWDDANKTAIATKDDITISLKIDGNIGYINNKPVELDVPARIKNSRTLVPVRFVAESFNVNVTWDDTLRAVIIDIGDVYEQEKIQTENLVKNFGENLKKVSLMAPEDIVKDEDGDRLYTTTKKEEFILHLNESYSDSPQAQKVPFFIEVKDGKVISITEKFEFTI